MHNIFMETDTLYFSGFTDEQSSKEQNLLEIESFVIL